MKTLIIGAGPAGLNCAIHASNGVDEVILIERNDKAGRKLYITGKGRCNVTNNVPVNDLIKNVVTNPKFLYSAFNYFNSKNTIEFFENNGVPLVLERGNRVFPKSYHASDITKALVSECERLGVKIVYDEKANEINRVNDQFEVIATHTKYYVDNIVFATGGKSYPGTGSTGDGYKFLTRMGHNLIEPVPALSSLKIKDKVPYGLNKMILKNVTLTATNGKTKYSEFGDFMFDHNTIDGPISLTISSLINRMNLSDVSLELDLKSALNEEQLDQRLLRDIKENANRNIYILLKSYLPVDFINWFLAKANINSYKKLGDLSKDDRKALIKCFKHFPLEYDGLSDIKQCIVTSGGIDVKNVDSKTMESKIVKNVYIVGELLDVDAFTGGFNIQIALSTGALAGNHIKNKNKGE